MPISLRDLAQTPMRALFFLVSLASILLSASAHAIVEGQPIQASGDKEIWNRATNRVELFGNAVVRQMGESLQADYIVMDQNARILDAYGNCIYITADTVIFGAEMHFNLDTRTGSVVGGRVSTDRFTLAGERINKLGPSRFQTHWGEYSTCRDCPQSWTFQARDVDMEVEGYAFMKDVRLKVKDVSALWFPYLILPMKTQRQSGFLFPRYQINASDGLVFVQPYFWAINRSSDMTVGLGLYEDRGLRGEWEGRYALSERSKGTANFFYLSDRTMRGGRDDGEFNPSGNRHRWGLEVSQTQELPLGIEQKLRIEETSDNLYPFRFGDLSVKNEAYLSSSLNFAYSSSLLSANIGARRYRNLLNLGNDIRTFDPATVQVYPSATVTTNNRSLFGSSIYGGITLGVSNFSRAAGPFDSAYELQKINSPTLAAPADFRPGIDPLRKATRFSLTPAIYTTLQPIDGVALVPSIQYNSYYYLFRGAPQGVNPFLYRAYPLLQLDLSTQIERIYETDNPDVPRRKHLIRPFLTYSNIPTIQENSDHPFVQQIENLRKDFNFIGFNFDSNDLVPRDSTPTNAAYYDPLGNSLTYGFRTQLIERVGALDQSEAATYRMPIEFSAGQTFNLRQYQVNPSDPRPFGRLFTNLKTNYLDRVVTDSTYHYYPYARGIRSEFFTSMQYVLERGLRQRILSFDRSLYLNYTWSQVDYTGEGTTNRGTNKATGGINFSLNDYFLPGANASYNFVLHQFDSWGVSFAFQSPSQCWKVFTALSFDTTNRTAFTIPTISLNLTGAGFEGIDQIATQATGAAPPAK